MNQGAAVQSSPAQQMVAAAAAAGHTWWSINNIRPPPPPPQHSLHQLSPSWNDDGSHQIHQSCSQLLQGGLLDGEEKAAGLRTLENWEQQLLNLTSNNCGHGNGELLIQGSNCWGNNNQIVSAASRVTTLSNNNNNMVDFSSPKSSDLKHPHQHPSPDQSNSNGTITGGAAKKARIQPSSAQSTFKVRKEKLGDRITALHQLVSPFGKTDTASVLSEAIGYIRFLQSQIEALSLPYMDSNSACITHITESEEESKKDLKSRGLCLVPISCTLQVGSDNGADFWAPAFSANFG